MWTRRQPPTRNRLPLKCLRRRAERNYFLLQDASYLEAHRQAIGRIEEILDEIRRLGPVNQSATAMAEGALNLYEQRFAAAIEASQKPGGEPSAHIQTVV